MKTTARTTPQRAGKPRGTKGHFFTAPVAPAGARPARQPRPPQAQRPPRPHPSSQPPRPSQARPPRDVLPQRARPARAPAWDDDDDDEAANSAPSNTVARGTKVRSRRPTGAQELRALRLREEVRAKEAQRRPRQPVAAAYTRLTGAPSAAGRPAGGQPAAGRPARARPADGRQADTRQTWPPARDALPREVKPRAARAAPARALPPPPPAIDFLLHGEHIALDNLLKLTSLAPSGGAAKALVAAGAVRVDGQLELRKTCKIRAGQLVQTAQARICVVAAA